MCSDFRYINYTFTLCSKPPNRNFVKKEGHTDVRTGCSERPYQNRKLLFMTGVGGVTNLNFFLSINVIDKVAEMKGDFYTLGITL